MSHRNDEKSTLIILKSQQEPAGIDWTGSKFEQYFSLLQIDTFNLLT